jgi:thiol-disulfide isomerase/thioredoxin
MVERVSTSSADRTFAALDRAGTWLSSPPLGADDLRGRVVLVDFWTYSCVNWLRTLPYVRAWAAAYRDHGLVVVGAHAPEFGFEHELGNVRRAIAELGVEYPVVIDNDFAIWRSFGNQYWPAVYLVGREGDVRFTHFGEGAYEETELALRDLLGVGDEVPLVEVEAGGLAEPADWPRLGSPETYVGRARGERRTDLAPSELALNEWTLSGDWSVSGESAVSNEPGGAIAYRFDARDVNLVMAPPEGDGRGAIPFTVRLDGAAPGDDHGLDADASGAGVLDEPRMYQLVRLHGGARARTLEVTFAEPGARLYVFTFG